MLTPEATVSPSRLRHTGQSVWVLASRLGSGANVCVRYFALIPIIWVLAVFVPVCLPSSSSLFLLGFSRTLKQGPAVPRLPQPLSTFALPAHLDNGSTTNKYRASRLVEAHASCVTSAIPTVSPQRLASSTPLSALAPSTSYP